MKKILIAETNPVTQQVLEITFTDLQDFEGEVMFADTPDEAQNLIKIHKPDLFLASDSQEFQDLDKLIEDVRRIDVSANIPIIAIFNPEKSVNSQDDRVYKMRKPFSAIKLLGLIKDLLNGKIDAGIEDLYFKPTITQEIILPQMNEEDNEVTTEVQPEIKPEVKSNVFAEMAALIDEDSDEEQSFNSDKEFTQKGNDENPFSKNTENDNPFKTIAESFSDDEEEMKEDEYKTTALSNPFLSALKEMEDEL